MKNSKIAKLLAISLSLLLLVGIAVMISATAEDATEAQVVYTDKVGIASINLSYKAQTEMAFAVYDGLEVAEGAKKNVYLLFFNSDPGDISAEELYKKAVARKSAAGTVKLDGVDHLLFYSDGIMANNLAKSLYVCPVVIETVVDGDSYTYNYMRGYGMKKADADYDYTARACSPVSYARQKIIDAMASGVELNPEDALLYSEIISYAAAALAKQGEVLVFEESTLVVNGGTIGNVTDGATTQTVNVKDYPAGATVTLRAEAKNAAGEYFLRWEDINGETVSTERVVFGAPVHNDLGYVLYNAVYGGASESPYASVVDFENLSVLDGENYVTPTNPLVLPVFVEGKTANNSKVDIFNTTTKEAVLNLTNRCHYEADASAEGGYKIKGQTIITLDDDTYASGDKNLTINATSTLGSYSQTIRNYTNANASAVEFDLRVNSFSQEGNFTRFIVYSEVDSATKRYQFTVNVAIFGNEADGYTLKVGSMRTTTAGDQWYNETSNPLAIPVTDASLVTGYKFDSLDEIFLIKVWVDDSGAYPVAYISVNGQQMFCGAGTSINVNGAPKSTGYFNNVYAGYSAGASKIGYMNQFFYGGVGGSVTLDNVNFTDK